MDKEEIKKRARVVNKIFDLYTKELDGLKIERDQILNDFSKELAEARLEKLRKKINE